MEDVDAEPAEIEALTTFHDYVNLCASETLALDDLAVACVAEQQRTRRLAHFERTACVVGVAMGDENMRNWRRFRFRNGRHALGMVVVIVPPRIDQQRCAGSRDEKDVRSGEAGKRPPANRNLVNAGRYLHGTDYCSVHTLPRLS